MKKRKKGKMFFYVDESGQTGLNLFDEAQPYLFYGVLSSKYNLDIRCEEIVKEMRKKCNVDRMHSNKIGYKGLECVAYELYKLIDEFCIKFDFYSINKKDHVIISFFDQVFDCYMNKAVPWTAYWTPLRYVLLLKLAFLFDDDLLKNAWSARVELNDNASNYMLKDICSQLIARVDAIPDQRSIEILKDSLMYASKYPEEICYNVSSKNDRLHISPNLICFQSVMHGIAMRLGASNRSAEKIIVDRQLDFNKSQEFMADFYRKTKKVDFISGPGLPVMDLKNIPDIPITCVAGDSSCGLEIVDMLIWIYKRVYENSNIPKILKNIPLMMGENSQFREISLHALQEQWVGWFNKLPEPTVEQMEKGQEIFRIQEERRRPYIENL